MDTDDEVLKLQLPHNNETEIETEIFSLTDSEDLFDQNLFSDEDNSYNQDSNLYVIDVHNKDDKLEHINEGQNQSVHMCNDNADLRKLLASWKFDHLTDHFISKFCNIYPYFV